MSKKDKRTGECTSLKNKVTKITDVLKQSVELPGVIAYAIKEFYESTSIGIECRSFGVYDFKKKLTGNSNPPTNYEIMTYLKWLPAGYSSTLASDFKNGWWRSLDDISYQTLDNYADQMKISSKAKEKKVFKVPQLVHSVWLTNEDNPREIYKQDIANVIYNKNFLKSHNSNWTYIVWVNDKKLMPKSIKSLEDGGIEVRSIEDFKSNIMLYELITSLIEKQAFGMASDTLRYAIMHNEGGVYLDLNYRLQQNIETYCKKYDHFSVDGRNHFFIAKAGHIIEKKALEKIEENFKNPPIYLPELHKGKGTVAAVHHPFILAMLQYSNQDGNLDFYYDYYWSHGQSDSGPIGTDNYSSSGTWMEL